ncbi:MAG: fibronectin type III-like domain-contianing protein, partial [Bacteroidota bacterium]
LSSGRPYNGEAFSKFKSNYLDIPNEPLYPFGYGLSYTTFEYGQPTISDSLLTRRGQITVSVPVKNTGNRIGKEIVQLYIRDVVGSISRPMKELKGFEKIALAPGEEKTVTFRIDAELLKFYNSQLEYVVESGEFQVLVGPNSREVQMVKFVYE